jgi:ABC-type multidrug transport system fused ATPase/permease subunit
MLTAIMHSTMQFFESTPIGRIINRFSKDMYSVEFILPISFKDFAYCILDVITTVIIISISTPLFATIVVPLFIVYFVIQVAFFFVL